MQVSFEVNFHALRRIVLYNHGNLRLAHSSRETAGHVGSSTFTVRKGFVSRVGQKEQEPPRTEELAETVAVSQNRANPHRQPTDHSFLRTAVLRSRTVA